MHRQIAARVDAALVTHGGKLSAGQRTALMIRQRQLRLAGRQAQLRRTLEDAQGRIMMLSAKEYEKVQTQCRVYVSGMDAAAAEAHAAVWTERAQAIKDVRSAMFAQARRAAPELPELSSTLPRSGVASPHMFKIRDILRLESD